MDTAHPFPSWLAREERKADRRPVRLCGSVAGAKVADQLVEIIDLSPLGCRLSLGQPIRPGSHVTLSSGSLPHLAGWVIWSWSNECGIDFANPLSDDAMGDMIGLH